MQSMIHVEVDYTKVKVPVPESPATLNLMLLPHLEEITSHPVRPLVIVVPGGAYAYCSPREAEIIGMKFQAAGIHAAVLRYSVAPNRYPVAALELAWAIQYCRAHAAEWHVDPEAISVCGFSAGGHLAGTLGTLWQEPLFAQALAGDVSWRPDNQILCYPVLTLGEFANVGSRDNLLGLASDPENQLEKIEALSLETRVSKDTPPTFLWHTAEDPAVPVENSLMYAAACRRNQVPFELHIFERGSHGLSTCEDITSGSPDQIMPENALWMPLAIQFVLRHWKHQTA